jgi:hypothetical protein
MEQSDKFKVDKFKGYSIILWEKGIKELTGETKQFKYTFDNHTETLFYFYCCLYSLKKYEKTFDEFIDELDNYPNSLYTFIKDYQKYLEIQFQFINSDDDKKKLITPE